MLQTIHNFVDNRICENNDKHANLLFSILGTYSSHMTNKTILIVHSPTTIPANVRPYDSIWCVTLFAGHITHAPHSTVWNEWSVICKLIKNTTRIHVCTQFVWYVLYGHISAYMCEYVNCIVRKI